MAGLNARMDSFISLLLDVSGRARVGDVQGVSPEEARSLLQAFADAHPERGLMFDGEKLSAAVSQAPAVHPVAAPVPAPHPLENPIPDSVGGSSVLSGLDEVPVEAAPAPTGEELPSWYFEDAGTTGGPTAAGSETPDATAAPTSVPVATQTPSGLSFEESAFGTAPSVPAPQDNYGVPQQPGLGGFYGVAEAAPPEYGASSGTFVASDDFVEPPTPSTLSAYSDELLPPLPTAVVGSGRMAWWWYAIAWAFWPIGGIVGYFMVKSADPRGARNLLIMTGVILVVEVLITVAIVLLYMSSGG